MRLIFKSLHMMLRPKEKQIIKLLLTNILSISMSQPLKNMMKLGTLLLNLIEILCENCIGIQGKRLLAFNSKIDLI
jgi:hypothetical protein